MLTFIGN